MTRNDPAADIAGELSEEGTDISATTIFRILKKAGLWKSKRRRKPGLTKKIEEERLKRCAAHKDWALEDFIFHSRAS